jgi:hypothetical protein
MAIGQSRIIHAHLSPKSGGELVIWGEFGLLWQRRNLAQARERTDRRIHPFAPDPGPLRSGLGVIGPGLHDGPPQPLITSSKAAKRKLNRYYFSFNHMNERDNRRECNLRLPTSVDGNPLPSPALAASCDFLLPINAELRRWQVTGIAIPTSHVAIITDHIRASRANLIAADSLLFFEALARLSVKLVRFGALLPMSSGWQLDPRTLTKITSQLRGSAPGVVLAQHESEAALINLALTSFARQFAFTALTENPTLAPLFKTGQFDDEQLEGAVFHDELTGGDPGSEFVPAQLRWLRELRGYRVFTPSADRLAQSSTVSLIDEYQRERERGTLQLPDTQASIIDRWAMGGAPQTTELHIQAQLVLNLQTPGDGDEWWLEIDHANPDQSSTQAALRRLQLITPIIADVGSITRFSANLTIDGAAVIALVESRELLAANGLEMMLPPELTEVVKTQTRTAVSGPANTSLGLLSADALCSYHYELSVDGQWLSAAERAQLVAAKAPLVRVRGRWHRLDQLTLARAVKLLSDGERKIDRFSAVRLSQGLAADGVHDDCSGLDLVESRSPAVLRLLQLDAGPEMLETAEQPTSLVGQLRDYQLFGFSWLQYLESRGFGACLADDMGLGKTIQTLALLAAERETTPRSERGPTLLIVPFSAVSNWEDEATKFCPELRVHIHHGKDRLGSDELAAALDRVDVCLTSYQLLLRDQELLNSISWHRLIYDEVQDIKNASTQTARAAFRMHAPRRLALSGTPVENRLAELWSLMHLLNRGLLGSRQAFNREFVTPIEQHSDEQAAARLRQLVAPFILRRTKKDPLIKQQLPDKIVQTRPCPLSNDQAALYQATVESMLTQIEQADEQPRRGLVLSTITQLKQICNHPLAFAQDGGPLEGRSGKLAELERIVADALAVGEKTLCFTQYPTFSHILAPYLHDRLGCQVVVFDGSLNAAARRHLRQRFHEDNQLGLLLVSYGAGGRAVNMTAANHVVLFDRWWNPAVEEQAADRAYRIGQNKDVYVHQLITSGTLEERIELMLQKKRALADLVISSLAADITSLDNQALRELFSLSNRALTESWSGR